MPTYLVERYLPGRDRAWLEAALARLPKDDPGVTYLGSTYVPAEDSCFCRFEASDADDVRFVNELARVPFSRISVAAELRGPATDHDKEGDPR
ncbi:MAG TPA: nickel-binding protein [Gaiellaceae bacterium]|nr:nickel-binding protein [Gaiellaceae bacterium]